MSGSRFLFHLKMPNKKNISKNDKKLLKNEKHCVSIPDIKHA